MGHGGRRRSVVDDRQLHGHILGEKGAGGANAMLRFVVVDDEDRKAFVAGHCRRGLYCSSMVTGPVLVSVSVADDPARWEGAGFAVDRGSCQVGEVRIDLGVAGSGIAAWGLRGVEPGPLDGLDTRVDDQTP